MFRGNPHQDRNPFATKWRDRINTDRSLPPWRIKDNPKMYPGGTPPNPKNAFPTFPLPRREDSENWIPYGEGSFGPLAELTQKQKNFMGKAEHTPAFGVSKKDLWDRTKGMEKKGFFGWGAQEPTTRKEFNDYYNQLQQGESGNWLASAPHGYSTDNFYNPWDDQYYNDYEDDYIDNPMRDDYYVQDPFSDIWGNQGGPLYFG